MPFALLLCACAAAPPDADIRDIRPTQLHRGDVVTVEAARPLFTPGAPTRVIFDQIQVAGSPLAVVGRATSPIRVVFDADAALEERLAADAAAPRYANTTVSVEQDVSGNVTRFASAAAAPFAMELFPNSLQKLGAIAAEKVGPNVPPWIVWALVMLVAALLVALPVPVIGGLIVVWERKISAWMQSRIGPNRVGPSGWLQWLADGIKLILKEDVIPEQADRALFKMSPFFAFTGLFLVFMVMPFTQWVIVSDLNVGVLFLLSVTSLVVVSIIMGGWSSNSKWSLLGGMRSAAQIISYELPASVALLGIATLTGSLSTQAIVRAQGGWPWEWYVFQSPFLAAAFIIYYISTLAEGNRTPFDLPEAESELVSGYNTEYSGFRYAIFPLTEWVNLFVIGAVAAMLFFGGWQVPFVSLERMDRSGWLQLVGFGIYAAKIIGFVFLTIWIRWTLPRFRVDQMMNLCWKYFIPISFFCFIGVTAWVWLLPAAVQKWSPLLWFALFGLLPGAQFVRRVLYNRSRWKPLTINPLFLQNTGANRK